MRKLFIFLAVITLLWACQESLEDRAARESKEYTQRMCPTPVYNSSRTDSVTFDKQTKTYTYHCLLYDRLDDTATINRVKQQLHEELRKGILEDTHTKAYKEAGFSFRYVCRSAKDPKIVLYDDTFKAADVLK